MSVIWPRTSRHPAARVTRLAAAVALAFSGPLAAPAHAAFVSWIDWTAKSPTTVLGTIFQGNEAVQVTFTGLYTAAFTETLPEPYWGPASTYRSATVPNAPPNSDIVFIPGGPGPLKLSFSQALVSPIFAIASLGLKSNDGSINLQGSMVFDRPFEVLSNGPNYYANGLFSNFGGSGNTLTGVESSGTVRLDGGGTEIVWTSPQREESGGVLVGTYGFTIGVDCSDYRVGPATLSQAAAVPGGCRGYNDRSMQQQAGFEVRGRLQNRAGGQWVQGGNFTVAAGGRLENNASFIVGEGQTFTSNGELRNGSSEGGGLLDVRGTLLINANGALNQGAITLKGDNTLGISGRMEVKNGTRFTSTGQVTLEQGSRLFVGGLFDNAGGQMLLDAPDAVLEVGPAGMLTNSGRISVGQGGIVNRALLVVESGGELLFTPRVSAGTTPALDNRGVLRVDSGGVMRLMAQDAGIGSFVSEVTNGSAGTAQIEGRLALEGSFFNAGLVDVSASGEVITQGAFGSFSQTAAGRLQSAGRIEVGSGGLLALGGSSQVSGKLLVRPDARLIVSPGGTLDIAPREAAVNPGLFNEGLVLNHGTLALVSSSPGTSRNHENSGTIDNRGVFRIGSGALLTHTAGELRNSGRFQIDSGGELFFSADTNSFMQTSTGLLVNNGSISYPAGNPVIIFGGRVTGSGVFDAGSVEFGDLSFEPGDDDLTIERRPQRLALRTGLAAATSFKTGTMTFSGDLVLGAGTVARLKFSENGGNDRLVVGGAFVNGGGRVEMVFPTGNAPGLDQVFSFFEGPGGWSGAFSLEAPAGHELTHMDLQPGPGGTLRRGAVFTLPGAREFTATDLGYPMVFDGEQRFIETTLADAGAAFSNSGVLGIRNLPGASLRVRSFLNESTGSLLNSARFSADDHFTNQGVVKNRDGAEFSNNGRLENRSGATLENRGLLVNGAGGQIINQGHFAVHGELRDESLLGAAGQTTVLNDGGRFDILTGGRLLGNGRFEQRGTGASTRVDGVLRAQDIVITEGSLGGSGRIQGAVTMAGNARLEPGNSAGTLTVEGSLVTYGSSIFIELASASSFDRVLVEGDALIVGNVHFRLVDGFAPQIGQSWTWLAASSSLGMGLDWRVEVPDGASGWTLLADAGGTYDTQGLLPERAYFEFTGDTLSLAQAPVPEPATWALWLAGLAAVVRIARRRAA